MIRALYTTTAISLALLLMTAGSASASDLEGCRYTAEVESMGESPLSGALTLLVLDTEAIGGDEASTTCQDIGSEMNVTVSNGSDLLIHDVQTGDAVVVDFFRAGGDDGSTANEWWWYDGWTLPNLTASATN